MSVLKLFPVDNFSLADLDRLRPPEDLIKEKPGLFRRWMENISSGLWRVWRIRGGKTDVMFILGKEDGWLNIYYAAGRGVWRKMRPMAAMVMPLAIADGLKGLRAYAGTPARARIFGSVPGTKSRPWDHRVVLELSVEDFYNGR